jgi:hypothetical protein
LRPRLGPRGERRRGASFDELAALQGRAILRRERARARPRCAPARKARSRLPAKTRCAGASGASRPSTSCSVTQHNRPPTDAKPRRADPRDARRTPADTRIILRAGTARARAANARSRPRETSSLPGSRRAAGTLIMFSAGSSKPQYGYSGCWNVPP